MSNFPETMDTPKFPQYRSIESIWFVFDKLVY